MILRLSLIAGLGALAITAAVQNVSAVPLSNYALGNAASEGNLVGHVQYPSCHRIRKACAFKWGWRTGHYLRCIGRRGCA
jgi:hypothetical protein